MPPTKYAKSKKFAGLSAAERARRISKIRDPRARLKAEKFWGVPHGGGGDGFLDTISKIGTAPAKVSRNLVGDVPQLASSFYQTAGQVKGALEEDVRKGRGLPGAAAWAVTLGRTPGPYEYKKLPKAEQRSATGRLAEEMVKGIPGQVKMLADPKEWYENPGIQLLNLAAIGLPAARVASVNRLSRSIKAANPGMSRSMANKAALVESFQPGFVRAQGLKGGIAPRVVKGKYGAAPGRMPSRQPVIRAAQREIDRQAARLDVTRPESRWSASSKAQRLAQRQSSAAVRRKKAERQHLEGEVVKGLLGPGLGAKVRGVFDRPGRTDRPRAAAMTAGLEAPVGMGVREAAGVKIAALRNILEENDQLRPMQDAVDDLKTQRAEALEVDPEVDTTLLDKQIAQGEGKLDVLLGRGVPELASPTRTKLYNAMVTTIGRKAADDQIQQWDLAAWGNDLDNPTSLYDKVEVKRLADPDMFEPSGAAVFQRNEPTGPYKPDPEMPTSERIQQLLDHGYAKNQEGGIDRNEIAATLVDEDEAMFPGSWQESGFDRGAAVSEYLYELDDLLGPEALYQRMTEAAPFHFQMERALQEMSGQTMQVGQLVTALTKAGVRGEELRNSGLDRLFRSLGKNTTVRVDDVLADLAETGYFRSYEPDVRVTSDSPEGGHTMYGPNDNPIGPGLVAREGRAGEYHEMVITLPDLKAPTYQGRGASHWEQPNVVYHVRFQIYEEGGKKTLLIEEIQSDWASDYRRAKKQGTALDPEEMKAERDQLQERLTGAVEEQSSALADLDELRAEMDRLQEEGVNINTVPGFLDRMQAAREVHADATYQVQLADEAMREFQRWSVRRMPQAPMHQDRYLDNAIHNLMRVADENDVDEIVIVDGGLQAIRNRAISLEDLDDHDIVTEDGFDNGNYGEWVDATTGEPLTNEQISAIMEYQPTGSFTRSYEETLPERFKKLYGAEPEFSSEAYVGRYAGQADPYDYSAPYNAIVQMTEGPMPGTRIALTTKVRDASRKSRPLYQHDPAGVPKGATEFLANGQRRVTMFKGADATTWSHELIHVLTPDLSAEHRAVLERTVAGGRKYDEWGEAEHEALARAWDTYWRDGYAPPSLREVFADLIKRMRAIWKQTAEEADRINPETARVFDQLLGKRYNNTVILKDKEVGQVRADIADLQQALDSGDVDQMDEAVAALAELATQAEEAGAAILTRGKNPEQTTAILEGLRNRKNAVVEDFRRRGVLDYGEDAKGYFPHMSMWDSIGQPPADPVRMAATADVVGTPRVQAKTVNRNRNRLIRMQTGEVLNDPVVVTYILRSRLRLLETIRARSDLYQVGDPIEVGGPTMKDMVYVRNPDVTPAKMHAATEAANRLSERDFRDLSARQLTEEIDEINDVDGMADEMFWDPDKDKARPAWVENEANVRVVPRRIARNRLGDVFSSAPRGNGMAAVGMLNALFRIASIYSRPWRYVPVNYAQNAIMLGLTNPRAFAKLVKRDVARLTKDDPQLRNMIREEVGTIQATALPEFNTRPQTRMQRAERELTRSSGQMGEMLGRLADVPIREAAWLNHAGKYGFVEASDVRRLIEDPDLAEVRDIVSQRTKEDLIDFDTLTPYEKEVMTRWLALWPFIRGITKWPFMYAREYPMRLAMASLASGAIKGEETDRTVEEMGIADFFGKDIKVGKLDPSAPGREAVQNAVALMRGVGKVAQGEQPDLTAFTGNYLAPGLREVLGMATGEGRKGWTKSVGRTFVPGTGIVTDVTKGGDLSDQALRQLGLVRERTDGVRREVKEWMAPVDKVAEQMREKGLTPPPLLTRMQKLRGPYGDWKQYESETKFAHRDRGESDALTKAERVVGLLDVAKEHYPQLYSQADASAKQSGWDSFEELAESGKMDPEQLEKIDRYLYDQMFGSMEAMKRQAKEAGYDVE